jgi:hypothetical protein
MIALIDGRWVAESRADQARCQFFCVLIMEFIDEYKFNLFVVVILFRYRDIFEFANKFMQLR